VFRRVIIFLAMEEKSFVVLGNNDSTKSWGLEFTFDGDLIYVPISVETRERLITGFYKLGFS